MIEDLRFVQGAVARKDLVPELTHFHIAAKRVTGYNGRMALSSPIALDFDAMPLAAPFVTAIDKCQAEASLGLTQTGRLAIRSGAFKAFIDCSTGTFPAVEPAGVTMQLPEDFLEALAELYTFTSEDASRMWSQGVLFHGNSAYATNNVILVERWLGTAIPRAFNIPKTTIAELLRIKLKPTHALLAENAVTFFYEGDRWLWSLLYDTSWPDLQRVLAREPLRLQPLPENVFAALHDVAPFVEKTGYVWFHEGTVRSRAPGLDEGAVYELGAELPAGVYNVHQLLKLEGVATSFDYDAYPNPASFYGGKLRGAVIGVRP